MSEIIKQNDGDNEEEIQESLEEINQALAKVTHALQEQFPSPPVDAVNQNILKNKLKPWHKLSRKQGKLMLKEGEERTVIEPVTGREVTEKYKKSNGEICLYRQYSDTYAFAPYTESYKKKKIDAKYRCNLSDLHRAMDDEDIIGFWTQLKEIATTARRDSDKLKAIELCFKYMYPAASQINVNMPESATVDVDKMIQNIFNINTNPNPNPSIGQKKSVANEIIDQDEKESSDK